MQTDKRNSELELMAAGSGVQADGHGVGGRQACTGPGAGGGGYLDFCTDSRKTVGDPRLEDLRQASVPRAWQEVAQAIGVDKFFVAWDILHSHRDVQDNCGRVQVPSIKKYLRILRNRWIRTLAASGREPAEIRAELQRRLGDTLSERTIQEIIEG